MKLSTAAQVLAGELVGEDKEFVRVSIDSRTIKAGELFFALRGLNYNGHDFISAAKEAGAVAVVASQAMNVDLSMIKVADTSKALCDLACYYRDCLKVPIIAVTGSCGKTTTRALLQSVFNQAGKTLASEKSFNNNIGVPLTLLHITPEYQFVVCEIGANHPGEIADLTHMVKPRIAIITNAGPSHLEGFGDLKGVACAKGEIFQGLSSDGIAIINNDDLFADFWKIQAGSHRIMTFARKNEAEVIAKNVVLNEQAQPSFLIQFPQDKIRVQLQLLGEHNVMNALATATAAYALGLTPDMIRRGLELCVAENRRLLERKSFNGATIIDDTYNANPLSVTVAIQVLVSRGKTSVLVLGDMLELGENTDNLHRELGKTAAQYGVSRIYCYGKHTRYTADAFGKNAYYFESQIELIEALKNQLNKDDIVLVKGSLAMQMNRVVAALMEK